MIRISVSLSNSIRNEDTVIALATVELSALRAAVCSRRLRTDNVGAAMTARDEIRTRFGIVSGTASHSKPGRGVV